MQIMQNIPNKQMAPIFTYLSVSLLVSIMFVVFLLKLTGASKKNRYLPPSPPTLPLIGHFHLLGKLPHHSFKKLSEKYGPIVYLQLGTYPTILISSPDLAKEIMKTHDLIFVNRPAMRASHALIYGATDLAFSPYGEYCKAAKKICVSHLLTNSRVNSYQFIRDEEVSDMVELIRNSNDSEINLSEILLNLTCNILSRAVIGRKLQAKDDHRKFGELLRKTTELLGGFCFKDYFPSLGWIDVLTGLASQLRRTSEGLDAFLDQVINDHQNSKTDNEKEKDFVDILLNLQEERLEIDLTRDNIKGIVMDMFLGGTDSTATTVEWAMAELLKNPNKMKKAQEEVRRVVSNKQKIEQDHLYQMLYLKLVVKETLRLHAPAPLVAPRESSASSKIGGYAIPPKTTVYINSWAIQMDPKLWDKPEEFRPERFQDVNNIDFSGDDFRFLPFGAGRRNCPGIHFAMVVVEFVLSNLLYWFDWELPNGFAPENLDMSETFGLIVHRSKLLRLVPRIRKFP